MNYKRAFAVFIASVTLLTTIPPAASVEIRSQKGPRTEDLSIYFYLTSVNAYSALQAGQIDIMACPLNSLQYSAAIQDPNIVLAPYSGNDMFGFPFNLNETIETYPDPRKISPMTYSDFRRAITYLVDKDWAVDEACGGFAKRIDVPVPYAQKAYWNASVTEDNYPYEYSPNQAASTLDQAGFVQGSTPNPDYDPNFPASAEFKRTYPAGHPLAGHDLDPIVFCARDEEYSIYQVAVHFRDNLRRLGIPVDWKQGNYYDLYTKVIEDEDFHIYTGGQIAWRVPVAFIQLGVKVMFQMLGMGPTYMRDVIREYVTFMQAGKVKQYLEESLKSWTDPTYSDSLAHSQQAQGRYVEGAVGMPLWSTYSYIAYRKELLGVVNVEGYGILNKYTYLNAYREGGGPLRIGLVNAPFQLNILHSHWQTDYQVLDTIYNDIMGFKPYDLVQDQPWIVRDWTTDTWINPDTGEDCAVVDFWFRNDVYAAEPVTGNQIAHFTAYDYEFTCHYMYAQGYEPFLHIPHYGRFKDIYNVTIIDPFHVKVFMNITSYWAPNGPTYPMLPKDVWLQPILANQKTAYFETNVNISLPEEISLGECVVSGSNDTKIEVELADSSIETLVWGRDYTWTAGNLVMKVDSVRGVPIEKVWVDYWAYGDSQGYTPANRDWTEILIGFGPYYVTQLTPGGGGSIAFKRNPFFFMETPLLGEIDWDWKWQAGPRPRSGYYKIDIFDAVIANGAFGSQGTSVPDPRWFPGADVAPPGGVIDIYDIVTITSKYGQEFGQPP